MVGKIKKFFRKFETLAEYEQYVSDVDNFILPNVSLCKENETLYYNKYPTSIDYSKEYLTIEALEDGLNVKLSQNASQYCIDNGEWTDLVANATTPSINNGQKISFKITNPTISTSYPSYGIGTFTVNKAFNVEGNIMSLLYGDNFEGQIDLSGKNYAFYNLFQNCTTLQSAENLVLPTTTLAKYCYYYMFNGCTSLTSAPELPATTLANYCYQFMFVYCTSLTSAPELPATTLASQCYQGMFSNCTSLETAPALPSTTLATNCYDSMFWNCASLTSAPELPATRLVSSCYSHMFVNCTSLTTAPELPATRLATNCYSSMFQGCTSLTSAPELPATTLANQCYYYMFDECISLTTAPELPATRLVSSCYSHMFYGTNVLPDCSNIDFTNESVIASGGLKGLFAGTKVTDADLERILPKNDEGKYCLPATTLVSWCYNYMFYGCKSLTTAPELPATTLASQCYQYMFARCTSLTTASELLATKLVSQCYYAMFEGCSKLNYIKMLATDISASSCLSNWVNGVASSGTFVKNAAMTSLSNGVNGIPSGWTVENA